MDFPLDPKQLEDLDTLVPELCSIKEPDVEKINFLIIPDELNSESAELFGLAFSSVEKKQYRQIYLITDTLLTLDPSPKIYIPDSQDEIFTQHQPAVESLLQLQSNGALFTTNQIDIAFTKHFKDVLPFIRYLFPDVEICPILTNCSTAAQILEKFAGLQFTSDDLIIFVGSLSSGLTRAEALDNDTSVLGHLLSQDGVIRISQTRFANILNTACKLSFAMNLRSRKYGYKCTKQNGRSLIQVKGMCAFGYYI